MGLVEIERDGDVAILRLERPPANAIALDLVEALGEAVAAAADRPERAVVVTGTGSSFSSGIDVRVVPAYGPEEQRRMILGIDRTVERLYGLAAPVVAAVNGHAIGGGLVVALACDFRLATDRPCRLGLTEVTAGIPFPAGPMVVVEHELDHRVARLLTLTGRVFEPAEALSLGVVDELHPPGELLARAVERARALAAAPSYGVVKRQLRGRALAAMRRIVETGDDPMLASWIARGR